MEEYSMLSRPCQRIEHIVEIEGKSSTSCYRSTRKGSEQARKSTRKDRY